MTQPPKIYTQAQANQFVPRLKSLIPELRTIRCGIIQEKDQCDVEEVTSFGSAGKLAELAREKMDQHQANVRRYEREFEKKLKVFDEIGCDLKSIEPGLVDFYSESKGQLIYLCWKEDEPEISYWHTLTGGFTGRQKLP